MCVLQSIYCPILCDFCLFLSRYLSFHTHKYSGDKWVCHSRSGVGSVMSPLSPCLSSCSIALLILCSSPSDKDMNTVYMNKPATHGHRVWSQRKAKDFMLPVMIRVNITSVFQATNYLYPVRPLHGSALISAFNYKMKLGKVEFNEVELFWRRWLYSRCRTVDCGHLFLH